MAYVVTAACIDVLDKSCLQECPVDCLYEGKRMMFIHPTECVDCGACETACPQQAIFYEEEVPEDLAAFREINSAFFEGLGSPGGSGTVHTRERDTPLIASFTQPGESPHTGE